MAGKTKIEYSLELDVSGWQRGISAAIRDVRGFEQYLDRAIKSIDQFEASINSALKGIKDGDIDIKVDASLGTIDPGIERLTSQDNIDILVDASAGVIDPNIERLTSEDNVDVLVDASIGVIDPNIEDIFSNDKATITVDADLGTVASTIEELLSDPKSNISVDAKLKNSDSDIDELLSNPNADISVDARVGTIDPMIQKLLGVDAAVSLAVKVTGGAGMVAGAGLSALSFVTDPLIEADNAMQRFEASTGTQIEGLADMIENVYTSAWGDSRDEVARVMAKLHTDLDVPADQLEEMAGRVLDVANVMDKDFTEVISSAAAMIDSGFVPTLDTAFDGMIVGQQEGLNRAGDLLDTFREYSTTFTDMGFTMDDALTVMNSGLEAGIDNTDRIADAIREAGIKATTDIATKGEFLERLGIMGEAEAFAAGEITGKQYLDALFGALAKVEDTSLRELLQDELIGTISEDFGADTIAALGDIQEQIRLVGGEAKIAGDTINNTMGTAWTTIKRTFQSEVADYFNNELDFTGFMQRLKASVSGFFSDLKAGEGFGDSLSLNLAFATDETKLGDILNTLIDALLSVGQAFLEASLTIIGGLNSIPLFGANISTDALMGTLGEVKDFRFNLELGNLEEMDRSEFADYIGDALKRGNSTELIGNLRDGFETALEQSMSGIEAGTLLGNLKFARGQVPEGMQALFDPMIEEAASLAQTAMNEAFTSGDLSGALDIGRMLVGAGEIDPGALDIIRSSIRLNLGEAISGGIAPSELERLPNIWDDYLAIASPDEVPDATLGRIGMELDELFRTALHKGDFNVMEQIIGTGEELGIDTSFWQETLMTEELEAEATAIQEAMAMTGSEGSDSLGLVGAASSELLTEARTNFNALSTNYDKMTAGLLINQDIITGSFEAIGLAWGLLPMDLRQSLVSGFAALPLPSGTVGGGGGSSTTINQSNVFNNQTGAASSNSGQAASNAIRIP